jgi:two-component system response regulator DevR
MNNTRPTSVLLIDDNLIFLRIATRFLDAYDDVTIVGAVTDGEQALTQVPELRPDIVLIDTTMPDLVGGLSFLTRLRAVLPSVGIIALTLIGTDGYQQAALEAGADEVVPKAAMGTGLLAAIRRVRWAGEAWRQEA